MGRGRGSSYYDKGRRLRQDIKYHKKELVKGALLSAVTLAGSLALAAGVVLEMIAGRTETAAILTVAEIPVVALTTAVISDTVNSASELISSKQQLRDYQQGR